MPLYEMTIAFESPDKETADQLWEEMITVVCQGHGEGEDHVCTNYQWASSIKPIELEDEDD